MTEKRQLLAIMFTDIVGYTAMMGESEPRAVEMLRNNRELHRALIEKFHGEYLQEIGDGTLASFESAVDAVGCALELQRSVADDPNLNLRIGIHSGDVIAKDGDIIGDAVNVASRIEPLAATGGICVSGGVYESIRNKPDVAGIYLGAKSLKNVSEPVRVYGLTGDGLPSEEPIRRAAEKVASLAPAGLSLKMKLAVAALVIAAVAGIGHTIWQWKTAVEPASVERMALPLPDKPSIAVLPFDNMSGDPEQEYFSDGLTEDIITGLAKVPGLFVIARNSSFTYKGKPVKVQQVSEELGVRYVLEGSVRRAGDKVRITAQLVDAISGGHVWAENYDRQGGDVFAVIDEVTIAIMNLMRETVTEKEGAEYIPFNKGTSNIKAYEKFVQGLTIYRRWNRDANLQGRRLFEEALALDPEYAIAVALLADTYQREMSLGPEKDKKKLWKQAMDLAAKAVALDENLPNGHALQAYLFLFARKYDEAIAKAELAASLAPGSAEMAGFLGFILHYVGRTDEAVRLVDKALRLDPLPSSFMLLLAGITYSNSGLPDKAIEVCRKAVAMEVNFVHGYSVLARAFAALGRDDEARSAAAEVLRINPDFSIKRIIASMPYRDPAVLERMAGNLRKAGLPD
jgi:adenylate cyclase